MLRHNSIKWRLGDFLTFAFALLLAMIIGGCNTDPNSNNRADTFELTPIYTAPLTVRLADGIVAFDVLDGWVWQAEDGDQQLWVANTNMALAKTHSISVENTPLASGEILLMIMPIFSDGRALPSIFQSIRTESTADGLFEIIGASQDVTIAKNAGVRVPVTNPIGEGWGYFVTQDETYTLLVLGFTTPGGYSDDVDSMVRWILRTIRVMPPSVDDEPAPPFKFG